MKLDTNQPQLIEVFGEEDEECLPVRVKIPNCTIKDKISIQIKQKTRQLPRERTPVPDNVLIKQAMKRHWRMSKRKSLATICNTNKRATFVRQTTMTSTNAQVAEKQDSNQQSDLLVFISNKVKHPTQEHHDVRALQSGKETKKTNLYVAYANNLGGHPGLDVQTNSESENPKTTCSVYMSLQSTQGCLVSITAMSSEGRRNLDKMMQEKARIEQLMANPRRRTLNRTEAAALTKELNNYFDEHKHMIEQKTLRDYLPADFVQKCPDTDPSSIISKHQMIINEKREKMIEYQQRWKKYSEQRDQMQNKLIIIVKNKVMLKRIISHTILNTFIRQIKIIFIICFLLRQSKQARVDTVTQESKRLNPTNPVNNLKEKQFQLIFDRVTSTKYRQRQVENKSFFRMFAFRATFRRWGSNLEKRTLNLGIRDNITLQSATLYELKRGHAGRLIHSVLLALVTNDKMLKKFQHFE